MSGDAMTSATTTATAVNVSSTADHLRSILVDDLRALVAFARTSSDASLVDELCEQLAGAHAASIGRCIDDIAATFGFRVLRDAEQAAADGKLQ